MGNFTTVPDVAVGDSFPPSLWESAIMNNLNLGVCRQLADTTLTVAAAIVDFTSIPATFAHLYLVGLARGDTAAGTINVGVRFNGDTTAANYAFEDLKVASSTVSASNGNNWYVGNVAAASATAGQFSPVVVEIPHYTTTVAFKEWLSRVYQAGASTLEHVGGQWQSMAAINRLSIVPASGNFVVGSRFSLYGLPA